MALICGGRISIESLRLGRDGELRHKFQVICGKHKMTRARGVFESHAKKRSHASTNERQTNELKVVGAYR